jgi:hypothetical protein
MSAKDAFDPEDSARTYSARPGNSGLRGWSRSALIGLIALVGRRIGSR